MSDCSKLLYNMLHGIAWQVQGTEGTNEACINVAMKQAHETHECMLEKECTAREYSNYSLGP